MQSLAPLPSPCSFSSIRHAASYLFASSSTASLPSSTIPMDAQHVDGKDGHNAQQHMFPNLQRPLLGRYACLKPTMSAETPTTTL
eukprot:9027301-Pyramimonas_sp.AAC.1